MMLLNDYLNIPSLFETPVLIPKNQSFGNSLKEIEEGLHQTDVAIIGVPEDRNSLYNKGCAQAPDIIRSYLYALTHNFSNLYISDLGNIKHQNGLNNTYHALQYVVEQCIENKVTPVIIGGSHDLTYPLFKAVEKKRKTINLTIADSTCDGLSVDDLHDQSFLSHIQKSEALSNLALLGYQSYQSHVNEEIESYRLKDVRENQSQIEPVLRDTDMASFDISVVSSAYAPGNAIASPNGLHGEQFCKLAQYAGFSDRLSCFGIFGANPEINTTHQSEKLAAQALWHFLDGLNNRYKDYPLRDIETYSKKIVHQHDMDRGITFYHNIQNNRWWFNAGTDTDKHIISCSLEDYLDTQRGKLPQRIMRYLK